VTEARTLGALKSSGFEVLSVREEMRKNLITKLKNSEDIFPGIIGY
jgi:magnesium chelatase subunit I|tara:strand:- start:680 stop:817 length:138 start_codon:yes stop_codon:yes gene_type:complete